MPTNVILWPTKAALSIARFFCGAITFSLLSVATFAQESEINATSSAESSNSSSMAKSSEAPFYPSRDMRDKSLLAKEIKDEAQWLETEYGKILALYRTTEAKKTYGALILFHAAEDPQLWPPILENLRANLPRYGWETLAISLPQKSSKPIPARTSSSSFSTTGSSAGDDGNQTEAQPAQEEAMNASNGAQSNTVSASSSSVGRELLIASYVNAAFNFLNQQNQLNVVVLADNSSAHQILQVLTPQVKGKKPGTTAIDGPLQALLITNLQWQEPIVKPDLEEIFGTEQLPVLDIFFMPDNAQQIEFRDLHRAVAMRKKIVDYQQLLIDSQPKLMEKDHQSYLLGRVRGFMNQKASGIESKKEEEAEVSQ